MIRRPPRSTPKPSSAASDVYKRQSLRGAREISDAELVEQACSGDDRAFSALVRRHHASAYRVALSITRRDDIAQDVVQDAFIKAFRALGGFRGDSSFRTWMMTVTANEARATLRKRGRWNESSIEVAGPLEASAPDPAEQAVAGQESARARAMLDTCLLYTSPSPRDRTRSRMPSSA